MPAKHMTKTRGFTLTETAIVMGIVALILGAIWEAATVVYAKRTLQAALDQINVTETNARNRYVGQSSIAAQNTAQLVSANIFPSEMLTGDSSNPVINAWGGAVAAALSAVSSGKNMTFTLDFKGVPSLDCLNLLTHIAATNQDGAPSAAFISADGTTWTDETLQDVSTMQTAVLKGPCKAVRFVYTF